MVWPPLTTIAQPMLELAYTATTILLTGQGRVHKRLAHRLIERASTTGPIHHHLKD
jgi:LacI family transcriptional regulator